MAGRNREFYTRNLRQFAQFGLVGGSGTIVNLLATVVVKKLAWATGGITEHDPWINLFGTEFHIRWYHVFVTIAFLVSNAWNYQLNRSWTFKKSEKGNWFLQFIPFLITGIGALVVNLAVVTVLMHPHSPITLPASIFDGSTGLRTPFYWANLIGIVVAMPVNFVINKLWTFRKHAHG